MRLDECIVIDVEAPLIVSASPNNGDFISVRVDTNLRNEWPSREAVKIRSQRRNPSLQCFEGLMRRVIFLPCGFGPFSAISGVASDRANQLRVLDRIRLAAIQV